MSLFDIVDAMGSIARDRADKREQNHRVEHARPAVGVVDPADERTLRKRAYRAEFEI